jgi:hypothetical protein
MHFVVWSLMAKRIASRAVMHIDDLKIRGQAKPIHGRIMGSASDMKNKSGKRTLPGLSQKPATKRARISDRDAVAAVQAYIAAASDRASARDK